MVSQRTYRQQDSTKPFRSEIVPSDILAATLVQMPVRKFTADPEKIHTALARARRHYPILKHFNFTDGDLYCFSREVEDALDILLRSRVIRVHDPDFATYVMTPGGVRVIKEKILPLFNSNELNDISSLANLFRAECGKEEPGLMPRSR